MKIERTEVITVSDGNDYVEWDQDGHVRIGIGGFAGYCGFTSEQAKKMSVRLINELRSAGIPVAEELGKKTLRLQLKAAEKEAGVTLIVGQKEAFEGTVIIRNLKTGAQETLIAEKLPEQVRKWLK